MVFPSVPVYLDPPNWQQQPNQQPPGAGAGAGGGNDNNINSQLPPFPPPHGGVGSSSIRPGSMADQARLAKLPQPEACLKCPRCESTNTKFCYFNNYSLSQPRHFCKTCRRYWTRGGALRNVPVGGGCRRNKKSKNQTSSSASKSPVSSERQMGITCSNSSPVNTTAIPSDMMSHFHTHGAQFPFMNPLQNLSQFGVGNLGLNFSGIQGNMGGTSSGNGGQADMGFQMGSHSNMNTAILSVGGTQQFPLFEPQTHSGLFPFQGEGVEESLHRSVNLSSRVSQFAPVKMEDNKNNNNNHHALTSSRTFLGGASSESNQYWGGAGSNNPTWTDLSGLNSNSTSHLL